MHPSVLSPNVRRSAVFVSSLHPPPLPLPLSLAHQQPPASSFSDTPDAETPDSNRSIVRKLSRGTNSAFDLVGGDAMNDGESRARAGSMNAESPPSARMRGDSYDSNGGGMGGVQGSVNDKLLSPMLCSRLTNEGLGMNNIGLGLGADRIGEGVVDDLDFDYAPEDGEKVDMISDDADNDDTFIDTPLDANGRSMFSFGENEVQDGKKIKVEEDQANVASSSVPGVLVRMESIESMYGVSIRRMADHSKAHARTDSHNQARQWEESALSPSASPSSTQLSRSTSSAGSFQPSSTSNPTSVSSSPPNAIVSFNQQHPPCLPSASHSQPHPHSCAYGHSHSFTHYRDPSYSSLSQSSSYASVTGIESRPTSQSTSYTHDYDADSHSQYGYVQQQDSDEIVEHREEAGLGLAAMGLNDHQSDARSPGSQSPPVPEGVITPDGTLLRYAPSHVPEEDATHSSASAKHQHQHQHQHHHHSAHGSSHAPRSYFASSSSHHHHTCHHSYSPSYNHHHSHHSHSHGLVHSHSVPPTIPPVLEADERRWMMENANAASKRSLDVADDSISDVPDVYDDGDGADADASSTPSCTRSISANSVATNASNTSSKSGSGVTSPSNAAHAHMHMRASAGQQMGVHPTSLHSLMTRSSHPASAPPSRRHSANRDTLNRLTQLLPPVNVNVSGHGHGHGHSHACCHHHASRSGSPSVTAAAAASGGASGCNPHSRTYGHSPSPDHHTHHHHQQQRCMLGSSVSASASPVSCSAASSSSSSSASPAASPPPRERELHLHPSPTQAQMPQEKCSNSTPNTLQQGSAPLNQASTSAPSSSYADALQSMPRLPHALGRSFSMDYMDSLKNFAALSDAAQTVHGSHDSCLPHDTLASSPSPSPSSTSSTCSALAHGFGEMSFGGAASLPLSSFPFHAHPTGVTPDKCGFCLSASAWMASASAAASFVSLDHVGSCVHGHRHQRGDSSVSANASGYNTPLERSGSDATNQVGVSNLNELHVLLFLHAQAASYAAATADGKNVAGGVLPSTSPHTVSSASPPAAATFSQPSASVGTSSSSPSSVAASSASTSTSTSSSDHPYRIGLYTREERARHVARYKEKRLRRIWTKRVLYQVRKDFAVTRKRVGGRFIKKDEAAALEAKSQPQPPTNAKTQGNDAKNTKD